jgi:hypothetical protein
MYHNRSFGNNQYQLHTSLIHKCHHNNMNHSHMVHWHMYHSSMIVLHNNLYLNLYRMYLMHNHCHCNTFDRPYIGCYCTITMKYHNTINHRSSYQIWLPKQRAPLVTVAATCICMYAMHFSQAPTFVVFCAINKCRGFGGERKISVCVCVCVCE